MFCPNIRIESRRVERKIETLFYPHSPCDSLVGLLPLIEMAEDSDRKRQSTV